MASVPTSGRDDPLSESQSKLKDDFIRRRGYWTGAMELLLTLDEEYFRAYLELSSPRGALEPKVREMICIAVDLAASHIYRAGARIHVQQALALGATRAELMEVFELASLIGVHSVLEGAMLMQAEIQQSSQKSEETSHTADGSHHSDFRTMR
jgi:alkylhydroperoxidase/carboxymuconolactone decarboxylase family protein YurZ